MARQLVLIFVVGLSLAGCASDARQGNGTYVKTEWVVSPAAGIDAILLLGAASGDVMQANIYPDEIARVRASLSPEGLVALDRIDDTLRVKLGFLTGPTLAHFFSAGPVSSIDDVIASAADPVGILKPAHKASPGWDPKDFDAAVRLMPLVRKALVDMRAAGFTERYRVEHEQAIADAVAVNRAMVEDYDIIPEQERLLGRELEPAVELFIVNYSKPYGIRILGQRFIAYYGWDGRTQLKVAAHEIFHPPFDMGDEELQAALTRLRHDPWMMSIVQDHDPQYGYNSFEGVINEGSTQALDQIVAERLDFAREPGPRWRDADGGMHMFAAAAYHAMKESGFAGQGGNYAEWLKAALGSDLLSPDAVRRRAAEVVGQDAVDKWNMD